MNIRLLDGRSYTVNTVDEVMAIVQMLWTANELNYVDAKKFDKARKRLARKGKWR